MFYINVTLIGKFGAISGNIVRNQIKFEENTKLFFKDIIGFTENSKESMSKLLLRMLVIF